MHIQRAAGACAQYEYGCDLRRLFPWAGVASPVWGAALASVRPGESTTPDCHDELETFVVLSGSGRIEIDGETEHLVGGDMVLIPRNARHVFANLSSTEPLLFISIFWDSPKARERMSTLVRERREDL